MNPDDVCANCADGHHNLCVGMVFNRLTQAIRDCACGCQERPVAA